MTEKFNYVPKQYQSLLRDQGTRIGLNENEIDWGLQAIMSKNPEPHALRNSVDLLKAISYGNFPFLILFRGARQFPDDLVAVPNSFSLIPDPMQVVLTYKGEELYHAINEWESITTEQEGHALIRDVQTKIEYFLTCLPSPREGLAPNTMAIAKTISPATGHVRSSLTFGYPYKGTLNKIQMGLMQGLRR